jgi:mRNA-degrading endonuclease RelE of RelBE toxin-antitoxin system
VYRVELSKRALRDLRRIDQTSRKRLLDLLENDLAAEPQPANLDIKHLTGRAPWLRLRRGEYRALYRPLTDTELQTIGANEQAGFLVERVVGRRDLERAASTLRG